MPQEGQRGWKRWLRIVSGLLLLVGGLAGWLLPFVPGWLLVIPGLMILSREFHWAKRLLQWGRSRFQSKSLPSEE